jgi:ABC-type lipoprotein release transport system permease subunit
VATILVAVSIVAIYLPASRAAAVEPAKAFREEA